MSLTVQLAPVQHLPGVRYQWDRDTDILSAAVDAGPESAAPSVVREGLDAPPASGTIEVEGTDGSWLTLELVRGRIGGVQVAVWPTVRRRAALTPPTAPPCAAFAQGGEAPPAGGPVSLELSARVAAETDGAERLFHFVFGPPRATESARIADDLVLELDSRRRLAGLWLLNVPPFPKDS